MTKRSSRSSRSSSANGGYQEIPGNKLKLSWPFYLVWVILFIVIMWRVGSESRFPSESQLPAGTQVVLSLVVPDDGAALDALRRSQPPRDWSAAAGGAVRTTGTAGTAVKTASCPSWTEWVNAYYHGAGGIALFEPWGKQLQVAKSKVRLLPTAVPRNVLTFEQLHRLISTGSRVAPDLAFVPRNVYQQLVAAGDLLPLSPTPAAAQPSAGSPGVPSTAGSVAGSGVGTTETTLHGYGVPDVRQSELALLRLLDQVAGEVASTPSASEVKPTPTGSGPTASSAPSKAARLRLIGPEYLVILRTTRFPEAARRVVQEFQARSEASDRERQQTWESVVERAQRAAPAGTAPSSSPPAPTESQSLGLSSSSPRHPCPIPRADQLENPDLVSAAMSQR